MDGCKGSATCHSRAINFRKMECCENIKVYLIKESKFMHQIKINLGKNSV